MNYHKLDHKLLENLTTPTSRTGSTPRPPTPSGKTGADLRLAAAQSSQEKLKLILAGEPPYDIFVRWKPLAEQPIGWNPDLNDGVRLNIRPFVEAGILGRTPTSSGPRTGATSPSAQGRVSLVLGRRPVHGRSGQRYPSDDQAEATGPRKGQEGEMTMTNPSAAGTFLDSLVASLQSATLSTRTRWSRRPAFFWTDEKREWERSSPVAHGPAAVPDLRSL